MELLSHVCGTQPYISSRALQHIIINQACDKVTLLLFKTSPLSLSSFHSLPSSDRRGQASNSPHYLLLTTQSQGLDFLQLAWRGCLTCSKYLPLLSVTECEQHLPNIHFSSKVNMQSNKVARLKLFLHFNSFSGHMCYTHTRGTCVEVRGHLVRVDSLFSLCESWGIRLRPLGLVAGAFTHWNMYHLPESWCRETGHA